MNSGTSYTFSFSYDLGTPASQTPATPDLVAFAPCREYPLPDQQVLLRRMHGGKQSIVTNDVLVSLKHCFEFRRLEEHNQYLQQVIPELSGQDEDIDQVLQGVSQAGLMLSARQKSRELAPQDMDARPAGDHCLCILSCDRPAAVQRLFESLARNQSRNQHRHYFLVDDSRSPENQHSNRQLCVQAHEQHGIPVHYFGIEEQQAALTHLTGQMPEHAQGLRFLLDRSPEHNAASHGRTRNWGLLLGQGKKTLLVDDDILYQRIRAPQADPGIRLTSAARQADFFADDAEWQILADQETPDPAQGLFLDALGHRLPQALGQLEKAALSPESMRQLSPWDYHQFTADSRILVTSCGYVKDPGTTSNNWVLKLGRDSRSKLMRTEAELDLHLQNRNVWLGSRHYSFRTRFTLLSGLTGLDTSTLLPPYFPLFRNEDYLFSEMLRFLHPRGIFLDMPWSVPHVPLSPRSWKPDALLEPDRQGLLDLSARQLQQYHDTQPVIPAPPSLRLGSLGKWFTELGSLSDTDLLEILAQQSLAFRTAHMNNIQSLLDEDDPAPDFWKRKLETIMHAAQQQLLAPLPEGFAGMPGDAPEQRAWARNLWNRFGEALEAWNACTRYLNENPTGLQAIWPSSQ